jgi:endonuclease YncB( thermonuclease family)
MHMPRYLLSKALIVVATALLVISSSASEARERIIEGKVTKVRDVDTIVVGSVPVRLNGIDGPELNVPAGEDARRWMVSYLRDKAVLCQLNGDRTYDRWVGTCFLDGTDIGAAAIAAGQALDCARYSGGMYRSLETPAARSRLARAKYCSR